MGPVPTGLRKFIGILTGTVILLCVGLIASYPFATRTFAQDEPTDRPFPTAITKTAVSESTASPSAGVTATAATDGEPTDRPFPTVVTKTVAPESTIGPASTVTATAEATTSVTEAQTPTLTVDDAMATIAAMQSENKDLQDKLASAQIDKGATLYAVVIVTIGLILAFAVFFGLRRSGK